MLRCFEARKINGLYNKYRNVQESTIEMVLYTKHSHVKTVTQEESECFEALKVLRNVNTRSTSFDQDDNGDIHYSL